MKQEIKNILTISISQERFCVTPKYRLEQGAYDFMRHEGWRWSPKRSGFVFDVNEEGAKRVRRLLTFDQSKYGDYWFGGPSFAKDGKEELHEATKEFFDDEAKSTYERLISSYDAKQKAEQEAKKAKEEQANKNRYDRYVKIKEKIKLLHNDFTTNTYSLSLSNYNMSDLLARKGVCCDYTVKELLERFGMTEQDYEGSDKDVLQFSISYRNIWASRWSDKVEARRLMLEVDHYTKVDNSSFMSGGSGHFAMKIEIEDSPKIDFKKVILLSKIADDNFKKLAFETYMSYRKGDAALLYEAGSVNSIGMMREDEVTNLALASAMKSKFEEAQQ